MVRYCLQHYVLFSAIASPFCGALADRKGRKLMLLRSALGMGIVMVLMGLAQNIWQFLILRALLGLLGGLSPTLMLLSPHKYRVIKAAGRWVRSPQAALVVRCSAQWLAACSPIARAYVRVFFITASVLILCFSSPCFASEKNSSRSAKRDAAHAGSGDIT
ncbi:MFS transporter [Shigella boydii]